MKRDPIQESRRRTAARGRAVQVREARRGDRRAIVALWSEGDRKHAALQPAYFRGDGQVDPRLDESIDGRSDGRELFVAEKDGAVVGFVLVELLEPTRALGLIGRRGHIDTLVVAARARRAGCGRRLVEAACAWARARKAEEILLTVWSGNEEAEKFYAALGLAPVSRVMRLSL